MVDFDVYASDEQLSNIIDFNINDITCALAYIGLVDENEKCILENMNKYIFLHGDEHEIYTHDEIGFIDLVDEVYIFHDFQKKTNRGTVPCRVIATEVDAIDKQRSAIFFIKEINKATDGFNIFFIKVNDQFFIGIRIFNGNSNNDFLISKPLKTLYDLEKITYELCYINGDDFVSYFGSLVSAIKQFNERVAYDEENVYQDPEKQYQYIKLLNEIENIYKVDLSYEILRCGSSITNVERYEDYDLFVKEISDELSFIKSTRINSIELLFEAEEISKLAIKTETENNIIIANHLNNYNEIGTIGSELKECLDDPELMIKMLKQKRGLK